MALASLFLLLLLSSLHVLTTVGRASPESDSLVSQANSISPYLVRYWNKQITNNLPMPPVLFFKASPLTAASAAIFTQLVAKGAISNHLQSFCEEAELLCFLNSSFNVGKCITYYRVSIDTATKTDDMNVSRATEPSMYFRESMLKSGNVIPMPNLWDNMPKRSFLPRSISSKLPFSTSKLAELKQIFHFGENSAMEKIMALTLGQCEVANLGETKMCVASIEDMIDFATSILGHDVMVRSTEGSGGSKQEVLIGLINRIEDAAVTKPIVTCHQVLFPYMVYYCHSFRNVRVYEVDILDLKSKTKINHGVAICHMDTSAWRPTHEAFIALGSGPGQIEVCHWTFETGVVWTTAK
ncbi:hypothetical protein ACJRO7_012549 [Eucalyptus globulus]|uniref:BURP domain-containing protein n=1 Tax=Eucalyptus globulus TaxID=34317 RepID=A0ABD3LPC1_EUCGL